MEFIDLKSQQKLIRKKLDERFANVLEHGRYVMGPEVIELEERLADYVGVKRCLTTSSGTDSLLIALMALGVKAGDEVITVPYTWISTAEVIALIGAKPVFVDVEQTSWNMNPQLLEAAITDKTKAIMPVGIYGQTANMTAINAIADRHDIPVIEDAAQCFGATHHGEKSGSLSRVGCTSFFPSKPLGCYGDGGAIFTDDEALADRMSQVRLHGQAKPHHHPILGINGRLDTLQAAVVLEKLEIFDDEIKKRQAVAERYMASLSTSEKELKVQQLGEENTSVWAQFTLLSEQRDDFHKKLSENDIPAVSYYATPLHLQPVFADLGYGPGDFPVTEMIANQCISLPMNPYLQEEHIEKISAFLR